MSEFEGSSRDLMESIHLALGESLLARIQSGEATAAEMTAALKFLSANGVENLNPKAVGELAGAIFDDIDESELPPPLKAVK